MKHISKWAIWKRHSSENAHNQKEQMSIYVPAFWTVLTYSWEAKRAWSTVFAPVQTIFPLWKTKAVVFNSFKRMMTAAKRYKRESAHLMEGRSHKNGSRIQSLVENV